MPIKQTTIIQLHEAARAKKDYMLVVVNTIVQLRADMAEGKMSTVEVMNELELLARSLYMGPDEHDVFLAEIGEHIRHTSARNVRRQDRAIVRRVAAARAAAIFADESDIFEFGFDPSEYVMNPVHIDVMEEIGAINEI